MMIGIKKNNLCLIPTIWNYREPQKQVLDESELIKTRPVGNRFHETALKLLLPVEHRS